MNRTVSKTSRHIWEAISLRKLSTLMLAAAMILSLAGCGRADTDNSNTSVLPTDSFATENSSADTTPTNPIIYPEEIVEYQLPDIDTSY